MVSSMRTLVALALLAFTAAPVAAGGDVDFYVSYNCPAGTVFQSLPVNDCKGHCNTISSGASTIAISTHGITRSVYNSHDCTGSYQSVGIEPGTVFGCTNSQVGWISSVRCYVDC
jgi:hypothetical protein